MIQAILQDSFTKSGQSDTILVLFLSPTENCQSRKGISNQIKVGNRNFGHILSYEHMIQLKVQNTTGKQDGHFFEIMKPSECNRHALVAYSDDETIVNQCFIMV